MLLNQVRNKSVLFKVTLAALLLSDFAYFIPENKLSQVHVDEKVVDNATEIYSKYKMFLAKCSKILALVVSSFNFSSISW
jgi:hypothetical protein